MSAPRFLIVRFSAIGDCVIAGWAATSIRNKFPDAYLCWAVQDRCSPVIDRQELATRVWEMPRERWKRTRWSPKTWREQVVSYARLRQLRFDYGIDFQGHLKTALCLRLSGAARRIAARGTDAIAARMNPVYGPQPTDIHTIEWNQQVLSTFGEFVCPDRPIMPQREDAILAARELIPLGKPLVTISVGAGAHDKMYPASGWREVAAGMLAEGFHVVFLGGGGDPHVDVPGTIDLVGKMPLPQSMAAIQFSDLHLAADTGSGHIAAAYGVPVVSVFGPTDSVAFRPWTDKGCVLREGNDPASVSPDRVIQAACSLVKIRNAAFSD